MIHDYKKIAIIAGAQHITYTELIHNVHQYADSLPVTKGEKCVILSENRLEWVYAVFAIWLRQAIVVPVDATSTVSDLAYVLNDCTPEAIFVSDGTRTVAEEAIKQTGAHTQIIAIDATGRLDETRIMALNPHQESPQRHINNGTESVLPVLSEQQANIVALIVYTSGTTGSPKGVMLTFQNLFANIRGVAEEVPIYTSERRALILLPLHHILPLMGCLIAPILVGGGVAISPSMTAKDIMDTLCHGQVGIFIGVPRLWQTLYGGIMKKINEKAITRALYNMCEKAGSRTLSRLVFSSIRKMMGGHLDICVSGGAALDREISRGIKTLGLDLLEGYGMTETAPIICFTRPDDIVPGSVGKPLPSMECKLIDPETLETRKPSETAVGELCAKGPNVMKGYYNRPEETAAVIDRDGYIHTGDLAVFDSEGRVTITGRSKEIIVLSNGKNVQPAEIEYQLEKYTDYVKECAVTDKDDKLVAIIVPQDSLEPSGTAEGMELSETSLEALLKEQVIQPYNKTVENYKKIMSIFIYHGELPRTKLDKLQRFKLKALLEEKEPLSPTLSPEKGKGVDVISLTEEYKILRDFISEEKHIDVKPTDHIETDLAFDSLDKVSLQSFIEQTFGMTIKADEMADFKDIQAMADKIEESHTKVEVEKVDWHKILTEDTQTSSDLKLKPHLTHTLYALSFKLFFKLYNRLTIIGRENIPATGPFILAPNHQSYLDAPLAMAGIPTNMVSDIFFYATEEHVQGTFRQYMARHHNVIVMEMSNLKESILKMAQVIHSGKSIMIFPEGTRSYTGELASFKKTFAILSKELGVPVVPVRIDGAIRMLRRGTRFIRPAHVTVSYLPPVMPDSSLSYDELTLKVKETIASIK